MRSQKNDREINTPKKSKALKVFGIMLEWESGKEELGHLITDKVLCCDFYKCEFRLCNSRGNLKALIENSDFNIINMNYKTTKNFIFLSFEFKFIEEHMLTFHSPILYIHLNSKSETTLDQPQPVPVETFFTTM